MHNYVKHQGSKAYLPAVATTLVNFLSVTPKP